MELRQFLRIFRRRIGVFIVLMLIGIGASMLTYFTSDKIYEATTTVIISTSKGSIDLNDIMTNQKLAKTYSLIAKGQSVLEKVISDLNLDMSIKELQKNIIISSDGDTEIIKITVKDMYPNRAQSIANEIANVFQNEINQILDVDNVKIIDLAKLPEKEARMQLVIYILVSIIVSLICGLIMVTILDYMDNRIKVDEIEAKVNIPVIGCVPKLNKVLFTKRRTDLFIDRYQKIWNNLQILRLENNMKTIIITSPSYLEDKSSTAVNLGITMAKVKKKVLLVDCDMRKSSLQYFFNTDNLLGLSDILERQIQYDKVVKSSNIQNMDIITSGYITSDPSDLITSNIMKTFLDDMEEAYDYILLITPPVVLFCDTALISKFAQGIIMAVNHNESTNDVIMKAKAVLNKIQANLIGCIVNGTPAKYCKRDIHLSYESNLNYRTIKRMQKLLMPKGETA